MKTKVFTTTSILITIVTVNSILLLNACAPKIDCEIPKALSYTKDIAPVIEAKCFMCHAPDVYKSKASRNKIFDYKNLKKMGESGQLVGSITHAKGFIAMPYRRTTKIDTCSIALIAQWVKSGMKE